MPSVTVNEARLVLTFEDQMSPAIADLWRRLFLSGAVPRRLSRWQRLLVYFGLMRDPCGPFTHTFMPAVLGPGPQVVELWGFWDWSE